MSKAVAERRSMNPSDVRGSSHHFESLFKFVVGGFEILSCNSSVVRSSMLCAAEAAVSFLATLIVKPTQTLLQARHINLNTTHNKAKHNRTAKSRRAGLATLRSARLCWRR